MGGFSTQWDGIGDNKEFSVATTGEITIFFNNTSLTSADDDVDNRNYYFDTSKSRRKFVLRVDKSVTITKENGETLTNPITVNIGDGSITPATGIHREEFDTLVLQSITINVLTANTNIKLRIY